MNSKRIITILILSVLVISSLPLALADSDNENKGKGYGLGNGQGILGLHILDQSHNVNGEYHQNMQEIKDNYKLAKEEYQSNRQEMHQLSDDLTECEDVDPEDSNSETELETDCKELKDEAKKVVGNQLESTGNFLLKALEQVYAKIEVSDNLDSDVKESLLAKIQENINALNVELEDLESNEEIDENYLQDLIQGMKQSWLDLKPEMSLSVALLSNSKIDDIINKLETSSEMVNERIDQLESNDYDITKINLLEEEFNSYINSAEANRILAEELLIEFHEEDSTGEIVSQAQEYNQESKKEIHQAKSKLRELFFQVKMAEMEMLVN
ncbi:hypothetical protein HN385_03505 [archaeon]|jgi:hypothetical protein|nr:hypothetical protein [archaeon]MBT3450698.1 hypothetical protein [archaeon]MBT6869763.1 hypothetical protein [archaeon]MBT7192718.1 hypothetical protein [archaeon]MBT7380743.1 hypothetical protein [archaeon]